MVNTQRAGVLSFSRSLLRATRPRQWVKNLLVFAAPAAAGALGHLHSVVRAGLAGLVFILASCGTYLINDVNDISNDRAHPTKRLRPVAAGEITVPVAASLGAIFIAGSVAGAWLLAGRSLGLCLATYVVLTCAYSMGLKRIPYLELVIVSSGFVLRAIAGGIAVHVSISLWFLVVTSACALLIASGKRTAELMLLQDKSEAHRAVIAHYSSLKLEFVRIGFSIVAAASYALWTFSPAAQIDAHHTDGHDIFFRLSTVPFVFGLIALERLLRRGEGGEPEELALRSHTLQFAGLCCVALVAIGIYR